MVVSKLNLVDLAGSERLKKTMDAEDPTRKYDETIKKESMYINQSLSYLEQVRETEIKVEEKLEEEKEGRVYRNSYLCAIIC